MHLDISQRFSVSDITNIQKTYLTNHNSIIHYAWKLLMQCHPHDSICGTSIDQVANEMRVRFDQVDQISKELLNQFLQYICDQIDTRIPLPLPLAGDQSNILSSIIVFNPNDGLQTGLINFNMKIENQYSTFEIIDDLGNKIPYDHSGIGPRELISMALDKKALKQALRMIHEGNVAGMIIRDFEIEQQEKRVIIRATLSDHGSVDINKWKQGIARLELLIADPSVNEYIVNANSDPEIDLLLVARDVPGHGYRSYWLRGCVELRHITSESIKLNPLIQGLLPVISWFTRIPLFAKLVEGNKQESARLPNKIENDYFLVEVQPVEGTINITDKRTHQVYTGLNRFIDSADCGDLYNYCPPERDFNVYSRINNVEHEEKKTYQKLILHSILKIPARISNDRKSRSRALVNNIIKSTITVVPGLPRIDIHTEIDNQACDHRLRVHFPAPFISTQSLQDGHFEIVQRPIGTPNYNGTWEEPPRPEVPQRQFTSVVNDHISLTIANRGLPEVEVFKNENGNAEIAITLLRCVGWLSRDDISTRKGHAGPMGVATPEAQMIGKSSFDYSVIPGENNWHKSIHYAYSFNAPLRAISTPVHPGTIPSKCSFIENRNEDFIITTIKSSEDDSSLIVRGFNILSTPIDISIKPWRPFTHAQLVSLGEKIIDELSIADEGLINFHVGGNKLITIRFSD